MTTYGSKAIAQLVPYNVVNYTVHVGCGKGVVIKKLTFFCSVGKAPSPTLVV